MSLVDAVDEKYAQITDPVNFPGFRVSCSPGKTGSGRILLPHFLIMDDCGIERAGDDERLQEMLRDVQEIDLGKNRLSSWTEVLKIIDSCPGIESVNLNLNPLAEDTRLPDPSPCPGSGLSSLRTLILNSTGVSWPQVFSLLPRLPKLTELHLGLNNFEKVADTDLSFPNIRILYFNGNRLTCFRQVLQLGKLFPEVEQMFLIKNCLEQIAGQHDDACGDSVASSLQVLPRLSYLNLSENCLNSWNCLECLRYLPKLTHLRVGGNPLFEDWKEDECRIHVIAWLPNLERLNGSFIDPNERDTAERAFIRHFMDAEKKPARYYELEEQHGRLDPLANVDLSPRRAVNVLIRYEESSRMHCLNIEQTVGAAKKELCSLFSLNPANIRLSYVDHELRELSCGVTGHETLRYNNRGLHSYKPADGDEFILELK